MKHILSLIQIGCRSQNKHLNQCGRLDYMPNTVMEVCIKEHYFNSAGFFNIYISFAVKGIYAP